jgi:zona occludens toxin
MPINLYYGDPRSGKSYEVVTEVIKGAIAQGRRVVTNIRGVNDDLIRQYLVETEQADPEKLGHVVQFDKEQLKEPGFFCGENTAGFVEPGDLVVIDECWNIWPNGVQLSEEHKEFFRMHGHFAHPETGVTCDLVMITQVPREDISRGILGIVDVAFYIYKLKDLGLDNRYTVEIYSKFPKYRDKPLRSLTRSYDPAKFAWYKSHTHENAKELAIDDRRNIFKGFFFRWVMPLSLVAVAFSVWYVYDFLTNMGSKGKPVEPDKELAAPGTPGAVPPGAAGPRPIAAAPSSSWYLTGYIYSPDGPIFYLTDGVNIRTIKNPQSFHIDARSYRLLDDTKWINSYDKPQPRSSSSSTSTLPRALQ